MGDPFKRWISHIVREHNVLDRKSAWGLANSKLYKERNLMARRMEKVYEELTAYPKDEHAATVMYNVILHSQSSMRTKADIRGEVIDCFPNKGSRWLDANVPQDMDTNIEILDRIAVFLQYITRKCLQVFHRGETFDEQSFCDTQSYTYELMKHVMTIEETTERFFQPSTGLASMFPNKDKQYKMILTVCFIFACDFFLEQDSHWQRAKYIAKEMQVYSWLFEEVPCPETPPDLTAFDDSPAPPITPGSSPASSKKKEPRLAQMIYRILSDFRVTVKWAGQFVTEEGEVPMFKPLPVVLKEDIDNVM